MKIGWLVASLLWAVGAALGDEVVLFSAANTGPDAWSWEGAKLEAAGDALVLKPGKGDLCSVVLQERFAWMPTGAVHLEVQNAIAGTFTLQLLAFNGTTFLGALDVVKNGAQKGVFTFPFDRLVFPRDTDTVTFKLWVSRSVGTAITIKDLKYILPLTEEQVVYDKKIDASTEVQADQVVWTPSEEGGKVQLAEGASIGSLVFPDQIQKPEGGHLILQLKDVKQGTLTVQVCAFDANAQYLDSREVVKNGSASLCGPLGTIAWPEGSATFQVKAWIGGTSNTSAVIQRILVLR